MRIDYHVHTYYSDDSKYPMEEVVKDAIKLKIDEICFTDHVDYGIKNDVDDPVKTPCQNVDYEKYFKEIEYLKQKYPDIRIKKGLEFGVQRHTADKFDKLFNRYPLDFVILSCHQTDDKEFWTQDYQKGKSQKEYNLGYYNEIYEVMKVYKNYSVLGHLDHIVRYDECGVYPFPEIKDIVTKILKLAIEDNKGIEINTSSVRYGLKDTTPSKDIIKLYRDLGGKIITIGSDSHKKEHLGAYIDETKIMLKDMGFEYLCIFKQMKPEFIEL